MGFRRCKVFEARGSILLSLFKLNANPFARIIKGLPDDAVLIGVDYAVSEDRIRFLVSSESFAEVPIGQPWPILDATIRTLPLS